MLSNSRLVIAGLWEWGAEFERPLACGSRIGTYILRPSRQTVVAAVIENVLERVGGGVRSKA
jgi:hypothetical protein